MTFKLTQRTDDHLELVDVMITGRGEVSLIMEDEGASGRNRMVLAGDWSEMRAIGRLIQEKSEAARRALEIAT